MNAHTPLSHVSHPYELGKGQKKTGHAKSTHWTLPWGSQATHCLSFPHLLDFCVQRIPKGEGRIQSQVPV